MPDNKISQLNAGQVLKENKKYSFRKDWYVFYFRTRAENLILRMLSEKGYEVFYPVIKKIKIWKNRQKKMVRVPLFPNYMFVFTYPYELYTIRGIPHVVNFVSFGGKPATISGKEVEGIRQMLNVGNAIYVEPRFSKGEHVRIVSGPLKGHEGIFVRRRNKSRFGIQLEAIHHTIFVDINQSNLEKI